MGYSLRTTLHISRVQRPTLKKKQTNKQAKPYERIQTKEEGAEGEEGERVSAGVFGFQEQSTEKDSFASSSLGISKSRSKPG